MLASFLRPLLLFIPLLIIQLTIVPFISLEQIAPDLILILLVYYSVKHGQIFGMLLGFTFGLFFDLFSGGLLGAAMFSKTLAAFTAGYFHNENKIEQYLFSYIFLLIVLLCGFVDSVVYAIITAAVDLRITMVMLFGGFLPALYTASFAVILLVINPERRIES